MMPATFEEHLRLLRKVFILLRNASKFLRNEIKYLRVMISQDGIGTVSKKTKAFASMSLPLKITKIS